MGTFVLVVTALVFSILTPNTLLLIFFVPLAVILSNSQLIPSLYESGNANITLQDILIIFVLIRLCISNSQSINNKSVNINRFIIYILNNKLVFLLRKMIFIFYLLLLIASIIAYFRFGSEVFFGEIISLIRFAIQITIFFLVDYFSSLEGRIKKSHRFLKITGYAICISAYMSYILYVLFGIKFGEVQDSRGTVRFFGPLGDQLGFIVSFFCFQQVISGQIILALINGLLVFLTATRGAILSLCFGIIIILLIHKNDLNLKYLKKLIFYIAVTTPLLIIFFLSEFGETALEALLNIWLVVTERFLNPQVAETGLMQRELTITLAFQVFFDNFLIGVGYTGFRFVAPEYEDYRFFPNYIDPSNAVATTNNQYLQVATDAGIIGLISFLLLMATSLKLLQKAGKCASPELQHCFLAARVWLWSQLIGNQGASWMLPSSLISLLLWIILGLAAATLTNELINPERDRTPIRFLKKQAG